MLLPMNGWPIQILTKCLAQVDHLHHEARYEPHTNATFSQRYFFDASYYKPGGPVFLYIGGETSGESRFSNLKNGLIHILMEATNGLGVILENRYYGKSWPTNTSSTDDLRFLTTDQSMRPRSGVPLDAS